tara:strand:- start:3292 stop:4881 length:1590 start_codon:yes stop_codon:yes gene_type:complete
MKKFAELLENLIYSPSTNKKIDLLESYFKTNNTLENGYALSILSSNYKIKTIRISELKNLMYSKFDKILFDLSYDYVGDLAETISLFWNSNVDIVNSQKLPLLSQFLENCESKSKKNMYDYLFNLLDISNPTQRWAIIKILTGGLRIGVSEKTVKKALSKYGNKELGKIEKIWHGLKHPYKNLFDWLDDKKPEPIIDIFKTFHPMMLSNPIDEKKDLQTLDYKDFVAEWKWDGVRVQIIISNDKVVLFSRNGDNITHSFPDISFSSEENVVIDGELLVGKNSEPSSFNDLQQRLNRKIVNKKIMNEFPAFVKVYDILFLDKKDLRNLNFLKRRKILEEWIKKNNNEKIDLSRLIKYDGWSHLLKLKNDFTKKNEIYEGVMLKRKESIYESGRPRGEWFKWKRNPKIIDAILMYAQRGHGKRSSFYSDFTFGIWNEEKIVPIGKAYSGFTDKELDKLDKFVRSNTINRFGPVRETIKKVVFEIAFDSISESKRHKSGIALRFPRISKIRWDKPIDEVEDLKKIKKDFNII